MKSKYKDFYKADSCNIESAVQLIILLKEVVIHIPVREYTAKIPASFWRFSTTIIITTLFDFKAFYISDWGNPIIFHINISKLSTYLSSH